MSNLFGTTRSDELIENACPPVITPTSDGTLASQSTEDAPENKIAGWSKRASMAAAEVESKKLIESSISIIYCTPLSAMGVLPEQVVLIQSIVII